MNCLVWNVTRVGRCAYAYAYGCVCLYHERENRKHYGKRYGAIAHILFRAASLMILSRPADQPSSAVECGVNVVGLGGFPLVVPVINLLPHDFPSRHSSRILLK